MSSLIINFFNIIFASKIKKKFSEVKEDIEKNSELIYYSEAKHYQKNLAINGWLFLTSEDLIFVSNQFNFHYNHVKQIALKNVIEALQSDKGKLSTNGLVVTSQRYHVDNYIVENKQEWIKQITTTKHIVNMKR